MCTIDPFTLLCKHLYNLFNLFHSNSFPGSFPQYLLESSIVPFCPQGPCMQCTGIEEAQIVTVMIKVGLAFLRLGEPSFQQPISPIPLPTLFNTEHRSCAKPAEKRMLYKRPSPKHAQPNKGNKTCQQRSQQATIWQERLRESSETQEHTHPNRNPHQLHTTPTSHNRAYEVY